MFAVFEAMTRDQAPLSTYLDDIVEKTGLHKRLQQVGSLSELDNYERAFAGELAACYPILPAVGEPESGPIVPNITRPTEDGRGETISRHRFLLPIEGDHRLLMKWPDQDETGLVPVDADAWKQFGSTLRTDMVHSYQYSLARDTWTLGAIDQNGRRMALFTFVDLTHEQERQIAERDLDIRPLIDERVVLARRFVAAIVKQTADYFDVEIPQKFKALIDSRRVELTNRAAVTASLGFPQTWKIPEPELEITEEQAQRAMRQPPVQSHDGTVVIASRPRLAEASFADVLRVIRIWASAVERYPRAFSPLSEDQISDLLAATLNATLPGAQREVYTRGGKSDIFIQADTLSAGIGPEKVFICESKWATGDVIATEALDPQLFGYLNTHDTAAVLLLLMPQKDFRTAVDSRLTALKKVEGFVQKSDTASGWPALEFQRDGRIVRVCVATVCLPRGGAT